MVSDSTVSAASLSIRRALDQFDAELARFAEQLQNEINWDALDEFAREVAKFTAEADGGDGRPKYRPVLAREQAKAAIEQQLLRCGPRLAARVSRLRQIKPSKAELARQRGHRRRN